MAVTQSTYNTDYQVGFPGMPFKQEVSNRISRTVEDAAGIGFGKAAFQGAGDNGCTGTPGAGFLGITIGHYSPKTNPTTLQMEDKYQQRESAALMTLGSIWVTNGAAVVAKRDQVYVTPAGAFTNVSTANTILPGWFFDKSAAAGAMVPIVRR